MYAVECPQFNTGMLAHYLTTQLGLMGKASGLALLLLARINWSQDAESFGPRGTVNHLTARKIAEVLKCSVSTVHEHLAILRDAGIIRSEPVTNAKGATLYCRIWFSGFVNWLGLRQQSEDTAQTIPPSSLSGCGGSEKPETYQKEKNQTIIDLDEVKSVRFTELETTIQEASPKLSNGERADAQLVFDRFRSYNLRRGNVRIGLAALKGFAKSFRDFRSQYGQQTAKPVEAASVIPSLAVTLPEDPLHRRLQANYPALFNAWFAPLKFSLRQQELHVEAPSAFHRTYVSTHHQELIRKAAGPGVRLVFA